MISLQEVLAEAREMNLQEVAEFLVDNVQISLHNPQKKPEINSRAIPFHYTLR
jgi:hypothetical protein